MKAKELAEILLKYPDKEVCIWKVTEDDEAAVSCTDVEIWEHHIVLDYE